MCSGSHQMSPVAKSPLSGDRLFFATPITLGLFLGGGSEPVTARGHTDKPQPPLVKYSAS